jgi:hypothetical protein
LDLVYLTMSTIIIEAQWDGNTLYLNINGGKLTPDDPVGVNKQFPELLEPIRTQHNNERDVYKIVVVLRNQLSND